MADQGKKTGTTRALELGQRLGAAMDDDATVEALKLKFDLQDHPEVSTCA